jgi:ADP-heptose:LPS heptosyltransferase
MIEIGASQRRDIVSVPATCRGGADRLGRPRPRRVAVFRALQLGDFLCATPMLRALRAALPDAEITLIGLPWTAELAGRFGMLVDDFMPFPGFPGLPEQEPSLHDFRGFVADVRRREFELVIQAHGNGTITNLVISLFGAGRSAGFFVPGRFCPDPERFTGYPATGPEVRRLLALMAFLGIASRGEHLEFPLGPEDYAELAHLTDELSPGSYVCLHAGARAAARRWAPERFARVGEIFHRAGWTIVLTGSAIERAITARIASLMPFRTVDLAGRTSLGVLAALLSGARLLISNDTGVAHLADALDVPSLVLSPPSQIDRWAPLDRARHRVLSPLRTVTAEQVIAEAAALMRDMRERSPGSARRGLITSGA